MLETVRKYYFYWHKKCLEEPSQLSRAKTYKTPLTVIPKYFSRKPSAASRISCCFSFCFCSCPICGHLFPGDLLKGVPNNPFQGEPGEDLLKDTVMGSTFRAEGPYSSHLLFKCIAGVPWGGHSCHLFWWRVCVTRWHPCKPNKAWTPTAASLREV